MKVSIFKKIGLIIYCLILSSCSFLANFVDEQKVVENAESKKSELWPTPNKTYEDKTLGKNLQLQFYKQCEFCGFASKLEATRDYIPSDIKSFTRLDFDKTKVESIDINGNSLLKYLFTKDQLSIDLDDIVPTPDRIIEIPNSFSTVNVLNKYDFPTFIYTKNCTGIIQVALDGKVTPPTAALKAAINQDSKKVSALIAYEGWFQSPIFKIINDKNSLTTALYCNLWNFYDINEDFDGKSFYLKQFKGILIGRTASASEYKSLELEGNVNVSSPMAGVNIDSKYGLSIANEFSGKDWQTLIYKIFNSYYKREDMFLLLPNSEEIQNYFKTIKYNVTIKDGNELMAEGKEHTHYIEVEGISDYLISDQQWELSEINSNIYESTPNFNVSAIKDAKGNTTGCRFEISGKPNKNYFNGDIKSKAGSILVKYAIKTKSSVKNRQLEIDVNKTFNTSVQPIPSFSNENKWQLEDAGNGKFKVKWKTPILFSDNENPVDYTVGKVIANSNCSVRVADKNINVSVLMTCNQNKQYELEIVNLDLLSYSETDLSVNPLISNFEGQFLVPLKGGGYSLKPISMKLSYPASKI